MSSREAILQKVKAAQRALLTLPEWKPVAPVVDAVAQFKKVLESIGGTVHFIDHQQAIAEKAVSIFPEAKRIVSSITAVEQYFFKEHKNLLHHSLENVDVAIIEAQFGVAENAAVWVTEEDLKIRVLPFICEHLVAVVRAKDIVATMHDAYERIGADDYSFGVFIAGPSKTADIEQSLVLGAHGPKSMTVLVTEV